MGTPKPLHHHRQPAGNQPRGEQTLRVHPHRGPMEASLSHLPAPDTQKQGSHHGIDCVLKVGNQLDRQRRKGPPASAADKARNRNAFFLELREQLNGISPVGGNLAIASLLATDRTGRTEKREKIDPTGKKRFLVFPNRLACVRVGKLNVSAPCPRGGRLWAAQTFGPASLRGLVILLRSIFYLVILPTLISSVRLPRKYHHFYPQLYWGR
jgi:hypothetical protein